MVPMKESPAKKTGPNCHPQHKSPKKKKKHQNGGPDASLLAQQLGVAPFDSSHLVRVVRNGWLRSKDLGPFFFGTFSFPTFTRKVGGFFESVINFYKKTQKNLGCT